MIDLMIKLHPKFTDEDRKACLPVVEKMVELSVTARKNGLLALESKMYEEKSPFLKAALPFVLDAYDSESVADILANMILTGGFAGSELLSRLIMAQAVLGIQCGLSPRYIREGLLSLLGEEYLQPVLRSCEEGIQELKQFLDDLTDFIDERKLSEEEKAAIHEFPKVEEAIERMEDYDIQKVFRELSDYVIINVMYYGKHATSSRILQNVPAARRQRLISVFDVSETSASYAGECCGKLFDVIMSFAQSGEIYLDDDEELWDLWEKKNEELLDQSERAFEPSQNVPQPVYGPPPAPRPDGNDEW